MAEPHWTSYVGMAAGAIGAVSGIAGAVMGYISYRRSNSIKSLDLRLELRKAVSEVEIALGKLVQLLEYADRSRRAVASAKGGVNSGAMLAWAEAIQKDNARAKGLAESGPQGPASYEGLSLTELETMLVAMHKLKGEVATLTEKYETAVKADDEDRRQIREDWRDIGRRK